ncbi:MAG: hypothetical protein H7841_10840 [Magnetospirillum sp. WYHS-4]
MPTKMKPTSTGFFPYDYIDQGAEAREAERGPVPCELETGEKKTMRKLVLAVVAAAQSFEPAGKTRDIVAKLMTPAQVAEAERLETEWKPKVGGK